MRFSILCILLFSIPIQASWFGAPQKKSEIASTRIYLIRPEHTKVKIIAERGSVTIYQTQESFLKLTVPSRLPEAVLARIKESVNIKGDTIRIITPTTLRDHTINYTLWLPIHITNLDIIQTNGSLVIDSFSGALQAQIVKRGSITLLLAKNSNATLQAHTEKGRIESDLPLVTSLAASSGIKRDLQGTLGRGGEPYITLKTNRGTIYLREK